MTEEVRVTSGSKPHGAPLAQSHPTFGSSQYLEFPCLPDVFPHHIIPHAVENTGLGLHTSGAVAGLAQGAAEPVSIFGVKLTELLWPAVRFAPHDGVGTVHLALDGVVVKLEVADHGEDVAPQAAQALPQQEQPIRHPCQLEVLLGFCPGNAAIVKGQVSCSIWHLRVLTGVAWAGSRAAGAGAGREKQNSSPTRQFADRFRWNPASSAWRFLSPQLTPSRVISSHGAAMGAFISPGRESHSESCPDESVSENPPNIDLKISSNRECTESCSEWFQQLNIFTIKNMLLNSSQSFQL